MKQSLRVRLAAFVAAIGVVLMVMAWAAYSSWQNARNLNDRLETVDLESLRLADHFHQEIMHLNNVLLRYAQAPQASLWTEFEQVSEALNRWLDEQRPRLLTTREREVHEEIDQAYDTYMASAKELATSASAQQEERTRLLALSRFERQGQRLVGLARSLGEAHRGSLNALMSSSVESFRRLRNLLFAALIALGLCGTGLAVVVYRGLVRPLQSRLLEAQARVERQEKLASLGVLAAGVAHEVRNPLTAMKARVFTLQKRVAAGSPERVAVDVIDSEIHRLERIVRDFLDFARPSEPLFVAVRASELVREVQTLLAPQFEHSGVTLAVEGESDAKALVDSQQIKQVLINLAQNAADACAPGGRVELRVREDTERVGSRGVAQVVFEVADTGTGIPPEVERRLFDPFFTTKPAGTGLGLAIAARIVELHNGRLRYRTLPGKGTVFTAAVPRA